MGSKSIRDCDSPSASSFLLPQLRHSRRGSLASISSANQLDKEALSQALDQIHSSASQTESLTTFNEYTSPPPSSAGPDTKGIASELQGGLSGLYSRFRASVGNVKDIVILGAEDVAEENSSLKSPRAATYSPKPPSKNVSECARGPNSSNSTGQVTSAPGSGRQSPLGNVNIEGGNYETRQSIKPSTKSLGSASTSAKSVAASLAALKSPPVTMAQAAQPTVIGPALADHNAGAVKRFGTNADPVSATRITVSAEPQRLARISRRQSYLAEPSAQGGSDIFGSNTSECLTSRNSSQGGKQKRDISVLGDANSALKSPDGLEVVSSRAASTDSVRPFPDLEDGPDKTAGAGIGFASDPNNLHLDRPTMVVSNYANGQDDVSSVPNINNSRDALVDDVVRTGGDYQHMRMPLRKTMAPPLITRSQPSSLSISRASSSDAESLNNSPLPTRPQQPAAGSHEANSIQSNNSQYLASAATHRDPRTMHMFSQVKNKVLNKEYWMKDENARDCFYCGDSFSTFRRKHHCSESFCICIPTDSD